MLSSAFLFLDQTKRKNILPWKMLHENGKATVKSLPQPGIKDEKGMNIHFVPL